MTIDKQNLLESSSKLQTNRPTTEDPDCVFLACLV